MAHIGHESPSDLQLVAVVVLGVVVVAEVQVVAAAVDGTSEGEPVASIAGKLFLSSRRSCQRLRLCRR